MNSGCLQNLQSSAVVSMQFLQREDAMYKIIVWHFIPDKKEICCFACPAGFSSFCDFFFLFLLLPLDPPLLNDQLVK